jgi:hypothetical protein
MVDVGNGSGSSFKVDFMNLRDSFAKEGIRFLEGEESISLERWRFHRLQGSLRDGGGERHH